MCGDSEHLIRLVATQSIINAHATMRLLGLEGGFLTQSFAEGRHQQLFLLKIQQSIYQGRTGS